MTRFVFVLRRAAALFATASALLFACALVLTGLARADQPAGPYVEAFGGYAWPGNISLGGETDPEEKVTLERSGEYAFGGGAGYQFANGVHLGGKVRYTRHGCDEDAGAGHCEGFVEGEEIEFATLGVLATIGYTLPTALIVDPFIEADAGLGYIAMDCEGRDACPTGAQGKGRNANYADIGFMYGFCGGLRGPLTDDRRLEFIADACWHRTEMAAFKGVPHPDAMDAITAGARLRWRLSAR
jgi:hypothetical protein